MPAPTFTITSPVTYTEHPDDPSKKVVTNGSFTVLAFEGEEYISRPFEYRLTLEFSLAGIDFSSVVNQEATLKLDSSLMDDDAHGVITGVVSNFRVLEQTSDRTKIKCEAVLVPKLWRLSLFRRSRVFQGRNVVEIVKNVLTQGAAGSSPPPPGALMETSDFVFRLKPDSSSSSTVAIPAKYITREHVVQYQETDLAFVQRLLEEEGIYYYFEAGKLIITDDKTQLGPATPPSVGYMVSADSASATDGSIYEFVSNECIVPATVVLNDTDTESFSVVGPVTDSGSGSVMGSGSKNAVGGPSGNYARVGMYSELGRYAVDKRAPLAEQSADFAEDPTRKTRLSRIAIIRAEEIEAQREVDKGASASNRIRPGHLFTLSNHFLSSGTYLVTSVRHTYSFANDDPANDLIYRNEFECIPKDTQFRPLRSTPVPRLPGIMTARVKGVGDNKPNAASDLEDPYIDEEGRYRVRFPFEAMPNDVAVPTSGTPPTAPDPNNDASPPVRLAQPYAGEDYGMHFPNMVGAEMVFACIDGDLSRPVGLGMVPNPRFHTPVPNRAHTMRTQTPRAGAIMGDHTNYNIKEAFYFDKKKNVIRSKLGHQIVFDDSDGGANVGITLQTGNKDNGNGKNVYWFGRIDMGGYRVKSGVEQVADGMTEVASWLAAGFSRDLMEFASLGMAVAQSQAESGDYFADTYGSTTPVGVGIRTDQAVSINGANGVNIVSPNFFGMFSGGLVGDNNTEKVNQHYLEVITKTVNSIFFRSFFKTLVDEVKGAKKRAKENEDKSYPNPKGRAFWKWKEQFKKARAKSFIYTLFQRTGVNIKSAGDLNMSSLQSTNMVAGSGGIAIKTSGDMEHKANGGIEIDAHQGISISTAGRKYTGPGWDQFLEGVAQVAPPLVAAIKAILDKKMSKSKAEVDDCPLALKNESGDITFTTEEGGDIYSFAGKGGNVIQLADDGYHLSRSPIAIISEVGTKPDKHVEPCDDGDKSTSYASANSNHEAYKAALGVYKTQLEAWYKAGLTPAGRKARGDKPPEPIPNHASFIGSRVKQTATMIDLFGKHEVILSTDKEASESYIKIDNDDKIELVCGDSSLILNSNGTIMLKGKNITIDGKTQQGDVNIKGKNVTTEAQMKNTTKGMNVQLDAQTQGVFKSVMLDFKATGVGKFKGSLTQLG